MRPRGKSPAGVNIFDRIARWTAETFGFTSADTSRKGGTELPAQLEGMKEALEQGGIRNVQLPTYWPEGYEQERITSNVYG